MSEILIEENRLLKCEIERLKDTVDGLIKITTSGKKIKHYVEVQSNLSDR